MNNVKSLIGIHDWPSMTLAKIAMRVFSVRWSKGEPWWITDSSGDTYTASLMIGPVHNKEHPEVAHYMVILWRLRIDVLGDK